MSEEPYGTLDMLAALADLPEPQAKPAPPKPAGVEVAAICALLRGDPLHRRDRERIVAAVVEEAREHDGFVDPNRVRARLTYGDTQELVVNPRVVGAVYQGLGKTGVLEFAGYIDSTDTSGRNAGKPARSYRLTRLPEEP